MSDDVKYVCVVVDDFTGNALQYPNVQLFDYGEDYAGLAYDNYYYSYYDGLYYDYGDVDSTTSVQSTVGYYSSDQFFGPVIVDSGTDFLGYTGWDPYYGLYMFENYSDWVSGYGLEPIADSGVSIGHGDWVLESFFQQIDDPNCVEIIAIDVDFTEFDDFDYLYSAQADLGGISALEGTGRDVCSGS